MDRISLKTGQIEFHHLDTLDQNATPTDGEGLEQIQFQLIQQLPSRMGKRLLQIAENGREHKVAAKSQNASTTLLSSIKTHRKRQQ